MLCKLIVMRCCQAVESRLFCLKRVFGCRFRHDVERNITSTVGLLQLGNAQYAMGQRTARVSAMALHLNGKQLLSLEQAALQLQPASLANSHGDGRTDSPGQHDLLGPQQLHSAGSTSADSPSSSIFDAFASSPMRSRHGATSPVKSPSKLSARGPAAAHPASPAQFAGSPARLPDTDSVAAKPTSAHSAEEHPPQMTRRRPSLSPLVLDAGSPDAQPAAGASLLPGMFVPRVSPAASGESCSMFVCTQSQPALLHAPCTACIGGIVRPT